MINKKTNSSIQFVGLLMASLLVALPGCGQEMNLANQDRLDRSRILAESYGAQLQSALLTAMKEGGPVSAIDVCKSQAPEISQSLSKASGAKVTRTSLRTRNPDNLPNSWQKKVLRMFEADTQKIEPLKEVYAVTSGGEARYMHTIVVKPVCLACHGKKLSQEVESALNDNYPADQAIGYDIGDVRGAFSVTWPNPDTGVPLDTKGLTTN